MKILFTLSFLTIILTAPLFASPLTFTITPNADEQAALASIVEDANATIDKENAVANAIQKPHITPQTYLTIRVQEIVKSYGDEHALKVGQSMLKRAMLLPREQRIGLMDQFEAALPDETPAVP